MPSSAACGVASADVRYSFTAPFLWASAIFARRSAKIERV
jgi:hypothetical protein